METEPPKMLASVLATMVIMATATATAVALVPDTTVLARQARALLVWKTSLDDHSQHTLQSWENMSTPCSWRGISCTGQHRRPVISGISLRGMRLRGALGPLDFSALATLTRLDLSHNHLGGSIPAGIDILRDLLTWRCKKKKTKTETTDELQQTKMFAIWNFDGEDVYKKIVDATNNFSNAHCIGSGGNGSVYRVQLSTGELFAVKKLHRVEDDEQFNREVHALMHIRHRNIAKLFGYCSATQGRFLVYEYMDRGSLSKSLEDTETAVELDWLRRLNIVWDVTHALSYMHHNCFAPIVHRDIKSNNVLLDLEFKACISDFGLAKILDVDASNCTSLAGTKDILPQSLHTQQG
ncbi:hypothetical protein ZWY2020_047825 [Hordeum vulgare]|nr:hypothetical protein ZWY2020_047825 [Hordeum vulgare]